MAHFYQQFFTLAMPPLRILLITILLIAMWAILFKGGYTTQSFQNNMALLLNGGAAQGQLLLFNILKLIFIFPALHALRMTPLRAQSTYAWVAPQICPILPEAVPGAAIVPVLRLLVPLVWLQA